VSHDLLLIGRAASAYPPKITSYHFWWIVKINLRANSPNSPKLATLGNLLYNVTMIERQEYMHKLRLLKDKHFIKVVTGIRRCGKSTLLKMFADELVKNGVSKKQIIALNFEEEKNLDLTDWRALHKKIEQKLVAGKMTYVFLDEVQNIDQFERLINSLHTKSNVDLYVTGSNAYLLSSELATLLTGRSYEIKMLPFSFREFLQTYDDKTDLSHKFDEYLQYGGFPQVVELLHADKSLVDGYLTELYESVLEKDILARKKIYSERSFEAVTNFIADSVGSIVSTRKIANILSNEKLITDHKTISGYLKALTDSFVVYRADRFDIKGKQHLMTQEKYYLVDTGLRSVFLGKNQGSDIGHVLENLVYLELLRRGNKVYIGKAGDKEVDFVAQAPDGGVVYYQVAYTAKEKSTLDREISALTAVKDHNPKYLITTDAETLDFDGIRKVNAISWLLGDGED
jgi:predicted AAA+ superfamily ATPase